MERTQTMPMEGLLSEHSQIEREMALVGEVEPGWMVDDDGGGIREKRGNARGLFVAGRIL